MVKKTKPLVDESDEQSEEVFEKAAEVFRVMSAPMRLRIISALCNGEKNVGELLAEDDSPPRQAEWSGFRDKLFKEWNL